MTAHKPIAAPFIHRSRLGAGYSFKGNQYGLAVDNVVAYNVVLPDGTPVTANKDQYKDLFWALKVSIIAQSPKLNRHLITTGKTGWRQQLRKSSIPLDRASRTALTRDTGNCHFLRD